MRWRVQRSKKHTSFFGCSEFFMRAADSSVSAPITAVSSVQSSIGDLCSGGKLDYVGLTEKPRNRHSQT